MQNKTPLISVIVPVYKVEEYLKECVDSILAQTYKNLEIILVDDGSPDSCGAMCEEYAARDSRVFVLHCVNGGLSTARNRGLDVAHGEFIGFVDSDDMVYPTMYEHLLEPMLKDENVYITNGMMDHFLHEKPEVIKPLNPKVWTRTEEVLVKGADLVIAMTSDSSHHFVMPKLYRREVFDYVHFRDGRVDEDTLFFFDAAIVFRQTGWSMVEIPHAVYLYRIRPNSICTSLGTESPFRIARLENLAMMAAYAEEHLPECVLHIKRLRVRSLLWLMEDVFRNRHWMKRYGFKIWRQIWQTPNSLAKYSLEPKRYKHFIQTKYFLFYRYPHFLRRVHRWHRKVAKGWVPPKKD